MCTYLLFGFGDETEAPFVAEHAACRTDDERTGVPDGIQNARFRIQFGEALLAPGEMIEFFLGSLVHLFLDLEASCNGRMALVQALGRDLARMIHSHESRRVTSLQITEFRILQALGGILPRRLAGRGDDGFEGIVGAGKQAVERRQVSLWHAGDYNNLW